MNKLLIAGLFLLSTSAYAVSPDSVNRSSFTQTNDTAYINARYLDKITVGAASAGGVLVIYSSTYTTNTVVSSITLGTARDYNFDNLAVKGIYYVTTLNSAGVSIIYKN